MLIETLDTARDLGRLKEILGVMVRHGFGDTVRRLGLADRTGAAGTRRAGPRVRQVWPDPRGPGRPVWPGVDCRIRETAQPGACRTHRCAAPATARRPGRRTRSRFCLV